jgi:hypothetical protein
MWHRMDFLDLQQLDRWLNDWSKLIPKFHLSTDEQELELCQKTVLTTEKPVKIKMIKREQ